MRVDRERPQYKSRLNLAVIVENGDAITAIYPVLDSDRGDTLDGYAYRPKKRLDLLDRIEEVYDQARSN